MYYVMKICWMRGLMRHSLLGGDQWVYKQGSYNLLALRIMRHAERRVQEGMDWIHKYDGSDMDLVKIKVKSMQCHMRAIGIPESEVLDFAEYANWVVLGNWAKKMKEMTRR